MWLLQMGSTDSHSSEASVIQKLTNSIARHTGVPWPVQLSVESRRSNPPKAISASKSDISFQLLVYVQIMGLCHPSKPQIHVIPARARLMPQKCIEDPGQMRTCWRAEESFPNIYIYFLFSSVERQMY